MTGRDRTSHHLLAQRIPVALGTHFEHLIARHRKLFGFVDLVALMPQAVTAILCPEVNAEYDAHSTLMSENGLNARAWIDSGGAIQIWTWRESDGTWWPKIGEITPDSFRQYDERWHKTPAADL